MKPIFLFLILCFGVTKSVSASHTHVYLHETVICHNGEKDGDKACKVKDWESARLSYKAALKLDPRNAELHYKYGAVLAMISANDNLRGITFLAEIRESFESSIKLDPKHMDARWALVEYYLQVPGVLGGSESKARTYAIQLANISEIDGILAHARIAVYFKRSQQAETLYLKAIEKFKSNAARDKLIDLYIKNKEFAKADALKKQFSKSTKN